MTISRSWTRRCWPLNAAKMSDPRHHAGNRLVSQMQKLAMRLAVSLDVSAAVPVSDH